MRLKLLICSAAWIALVGAASASLSACSVRDCAEERAGQVRCVANRAELCEDDGTLSYTSCTPNGLFCSERHRGCVTKEVLEAGMGGQNAGGDGGSGGGETGGMGGMR